MSAASRMPCKISEKQYAHDRDRGGVEVHPAHAPHVEEPAKVEQAEDRSEHHGGQYGLGQVFQKAGQEQ